MHCDSVSINDNELRRFDFDLEEILKVHREVKNIELDNYNSNDKSNSDLYFVFYQIT